MHLQFKFNDYTSVAYTDNAGINIFYDDIKTQQSDSGWPGFRDAIRVHRYVQDHKSLCAAITICANVVNIQTQRKRHTETAFWPAYI